MPWPRTRWCVARPDPVGDACLAEALGVPLPLAAALRARGVSAPGQGREHLAPTLRNLVPPEQLPGVPEAATRIRRAVSSGEEILVFGDYDADGITASVLLAFAIEALGGCCHIFLPDRLREGYGLTPPAVERALRSFPAARLLVTVDCGIRQHDGGALCRSRGVDLILTDHHAIPEQLPDALAIINPRLPGTPGPLASLAGVGVAFKLAHVLARAGSRHCFDPAMLLPLVALGTIADVSPLVGENRILVHSGLLRLNRNLHPGLAALRNACRLSGEMLASDVAFQLGPRINAAGRIGDPMLAVELLRTAEPGRAKALAVRLDALNTERRSLEVNACDEAFRQLAAAFDPLVHRAAVVSDPRWNPGVVGLVAGRLSRRLRVPAVAFHLGANGLAQGSARSPESSDIDLMTLLAPCAPLLLRYGGHRSAAGLTLRNEALPTFAESFRSVCAQALAGRDLRPVLAIDAWVESSQVTPEFHAESRRLEPCGAGHAPARWGMRRVELAEPPVFMGREGVHGRLVLRTRDGLTFRAVFFRAGPELAQVRPGVPLDIAFSTTLDAYWGEPELRLQLDDLRPAR